MRTELNKSMPFAGLTVGQVEDMLEGLLAREATPAPTMPDVIGIEDVARITRYSVKTIYALVNTRRIPFHKPPGGRKLFFVTTEIYDWLKTNRTETNDEFVRNHRQGKSHRDSKKVKKIKACLQNLNRLQGLLSLTEAMSTHQQLTIEVLENQIAQYELQMKSLTKNQ